MSDWRDDPATEAQKRRLKADGLRFHNSITKGEASDLIGSLLEPEENQIEILKFFKISNLSKMSQTDAGEKIEEIFNDEVSAERWRSRLATQNQKEVYRFFNIPIPAGLTHMEAEHLISELLEDEEKADAWDEREDEIEEREMWVEDTLDFINDYREDYNCKKISKTLFKKIVASLEASGMTLEQIEDDVPAIFKKAVEYNPNLSRVTKPKHSDLQKNKQKTTMITFIIIVISVLWIWLM